jgi:hypothetical protein
MSINEGDMKPHFKGIFSSFLSKITPIVHSQSARISFIYDKRNKSLSHNAYTKISLAVPSWLPLSVKAAERTGTRTIQKIMERDLNNVLNKIPTQYQLSESNKASSSAPSSSSSTNNSEFKKFIKDAKERVLSSFNSERETFIF